MTFNSIGKLHLPKKEIYEELLDSDHNFNSISLGQDVTVSANNSKKSGFGDKKSNPTLTDYDPNQIPPSLSLALTHRKASGIGNPSLDDPWRGAQICPCCNRIEKTPYSFWTDTSTLTNEGNTIPLYFHLVKHLLVLVAIFFIGKIYIMIRSYYISCDFNKELRGTDKCEFGGYLFFLALLPESSDLYPMQEKMYEIDYYYSMFICLVMNIFCIYYQVRQTRLIKGIKSKQISLSSFTVMLGNVEKGDTKSDVVRFLKRFEKDFRLQKEPLDVINIEITGSAFNDQIHLNDALGIEKYVERLKEFEDGYKDDLDVGQLKKMDSLIRDKETRVRKIREVYERRKQRKCVFFNLGNFGRSPNNNLAFVTFSNTRDVRMLKKIRKRVNCCYLTRFAYKLRNMTNYLVLGTPEPEDVNWRAIGFTTLSRRVCRGAELVILALIFVFNFSFYVLLDYLVVFKSKFNISEEDTWLWLAIQIGFSIFGIIFTRCLVRLFNCIGGHHRYLLKQKYLISKARRVFYIDVFSFCVLLVFLIIMVTFEKSFHIFNNLVDMKNLNMIRNVILIYLVVKCFMTPFFNIFDFFKFYRDFRRNHIEAALKSKGYSDYHWLSQRELNKIFEKHDPSIEVMYGQLMSHVTMIMLYSYYVPVASLLGFLYVLVQSQTDKYLMYKVCRAPPKYTEKLAVDIGGAIYYLPKVFFLLTAGARIVPVFWFSRDQMTILDLCLAIILVVYALTPMHSLVQFIISNWWMGGEDYGDNWKEEKVKYYKDYEGYIHKGDYKRSRERFRSVTTKLTHLGMEEDDD